MPQREGTQGQGYRAGNTKAQRVAPTLLSEAGAAFRSLLLRPTRQQGRGGCARARQWPRGGGVQGSTEQPALCFLQPPRAQPVPCYLHSTQRYTTLLWKARWRKEKVGGGVW